MMSEIAIATSFDLDTYLKQSETEIKTLFANTFYDAGKKFKEVQDTLKGTDVDFYGWCVEKFGFSPRSVRKCIKYYDTYQQHPMLKKGLPNELVLEFGKPDTGEVLQQKVIKGEIKTAKELKQLKKELRQIKPEYIELRAKEKAWEIERKKVYSEINRYVERTSQLEQMLEQSETRVQSEFMSIIIDIAAFMGEKMPVAKMYLQKMDGETAREAREGAVSELMGVISLLGGGENG